MLRVSHVNIMSSTCYCVLFESVYDDVWISWIPKLMIWRHLQPDESYDDETEG